MEPVRLETERLVLTAPAPSDIDAITVACQDPEVPRWTPLPSPYTRDDAEAFVRLSTERWAEGTHAVWTIHADGELVGSIGLHGITDHFTGGSAELGYWIAAPVRGRGYAVEASRAVIDWGFAALGLARIDWHAGVGNVGSARAARALGFRYEGLQRQALTSPRGRGDGWAAALLATDDRSPADWPVL